MFWLNYECFSILYDAFLLKSVISIHNSCGIYPYNPDAIDKSYLMPTINITPQPAETPHSSKTPNETKKEGTCN